MTVREYITNRFISFGAMNYEAEVEGVVVSGGLSPDATLSKDNFRAVEVAFVRRIPDLLLLPTSVSELGVSISRASADSLRQYYSIKCKEYGIKDELSDKPKVRFL